MASMATRAIMSLRPPSGLNQPMRRQNSLDKAAAGGLRLGGDQRAQQRHFFNGEVAPVIAALDRAGHPGAVKFAPALLAHRPWQPGRQVVRRFASPRTLRATLPASASTSMPFIESVPTTEYMIAVNLAPSSLSEPNDKPSPY